MMDFQKSIKVDEQDYNHNSSSTYYSSYENNQCCRQEGDDMWRVQVHAWNLRIIGKGENE